MDIFSNLNMLTKEKSLFGSVEGSGGGSGNGNINKASTPVVQGWLSKTWKKITKPFKAVGNLLSGKLPKINANANIITPNYKGSFKTKIFGKMDFSDLLKFSVPTSVGFGSTAYGIFKAEMEASLSMTRRGQASGKCYAYELEFNEDQLPCLNQDVIDYLDKLYDTAEYTDAELNEFFDKFGTHAIMGATFGSKIFLQTKYDVSTLADCGITGEVKMDPINGWCDFTNGASCNMASNGTATNSATCNSNTEIFQDMSGFTKGSPGWAGGWDPISRVDLWLTAATVEKSLLLDNPVIIEDMQLVDICNFIAIALYQENEDLSLPYRRILELLNDHYFRSKYYTHLFEQGRIKCEPTNCEICSQDSAVCEKCAEGYQLFGGLCNDVSSMAFAFIKSMAEGPNFDLEKYGPQDHYSKDIRALYK